ncbi:hypothetical protein [Aquipuribacter sp. SD81]|uniref:hypothetical protein n=1 Tax=Aquipuribacter sp. SD81 TaxID=3127703 RepID=UPI003019D69D
MSTRGLLARTVAGVTGAVLLTGVAGAAFADPVDGEAENVEIGVTIDGLEPAGALTMSVASSSTELAEVDTDEEGIRRFDGTLPTVTVTDDRDVAPESAYWYVTGQSSDFTAAEGDATLPAGHLGWTPEVLTDNDGEVAAGDQVLTILDEGPDAVGLVGEELLALALDSTEAAATGTWQANADLFLKTPEDVPAGDYSATLTLTLWEDSY